MTRTESLAILRGMVAAWPSRELSDDTVEVWVGKLEHIPYDDGLDVLSLLTDETAFFPSVADFRARWLELRKNRRLDEGFKALPSPEVPPEQAKANIERLREILSEIGSRPVVDPKYVGLPRRRRRGGPPPEPCPEYDHAHCGDGPLRDLSA